jgi:Tfp pilus assembly protein PilO
MTAHVQKDNIYNIGFFKALGIVATAFLVGCVTAAFTVGSVLNNDHFTLLAVAQEQRSFATTYQRKDTTELQLSNISSQLTEIKNRMERLEQKLNK